MKKILITSILAIMLVPTALFAGEELRPSQPPPGERSTMPTMKKPVYNGEMGNRQEGMKNGFSGSVRPPVSPGKVGSGMIRPPIGSGGVFPPKGSGALRPPVGSGASNEKEVAGLLMAINQLPPTDRATLIKTIKEFLTSKGIDPTKYAEIRKEINETKKQTQEELNEMRKKVLEDAKEKREDMKNKINEVRSQGKATFKEFTVTK